MDNDVSSEEDKIGLIFFISLCWNKMCLTLLHEVLMITKY